MGPAAQRVTSLPTSVAAWSTSSGAHPDELCYVRKPTLQFLFPLLVVALLLAAIFLLSRSGVLFRISIRDGKVAVVRGYVPGALLDDFAGAVRHVTRGEIRAHKSGGYVNLSFRGDVDDGAAQRLRNILGLYPVARLRAPSLGSQAR